MSYDPTKVRRTAYDVTWDPSSTNHNLGGIDEVRFECPLQFAAVKIGSAGNLKLGDRFIGLGDDARIITVVREVTLARIRVLFPWDDGAGEVDLTPIYGADMAALAKPLLLHPIDKVDGLGNADTTEDITIFKALPIPSPVRRTGTDFDVWEVPWLIYPDLTKLSTGVAAYMEMKGS